MKTSKTSKKLVSIFALFQILGVPWLNLHYKGMEFKDKATQVKLTLIK